MISNVLKSIAVIGTASIMVLSACNNKEAGKDPKKQNEKTETSKTLFNNPEKEQEVAELDSKTSNLPKPVTFDEKFSYLKGLELGSNFKEAAMNPKIDYFKLGLEQGFNGKFDYIPKEELASMQQEVMKEFQAKMEKVVQKKKKEFEALGPKYKKLSDDFLKANKTKPGVKVSPSGLQYKIIKEGNGLTASMGDVLMIHLKGSFVDGTIFEDTFNQDPIPMQLDKQIFPAWREAFLMMKPGSRIIIYAPADLLYGEKGVFPNVPPNSAMIFEFELVENRGKK